MSGGANTLKTEDSFDVSVRSVVQYAIDNSTDLPSTDLAYSLNPPMVKICKEHAEILLELARAVEWWFSIPRSYSQFAEQQSRDMVQSYLDKVTDKQGWPRP